MKKNNDFSHRKAVILYYPQSAAKIEAVIKKQHFADATKQQSDSPLLWERGEV